MTSFNNIKYKFMKLHSHFEIDVVMCCWENIVEQKEGYFADYRETLGIGELRTHVVLTIAPIVETLWVQLESEWCRSPNNEGCFDIEFVPEVIELIESTNCIDFDDLETAMKAIIAKQCITELKAYTVIFNYISSGHNWIDTVEATSPENARYEALAMLAEHNGWPLEEAANDTEFVCVIPGSHCACL